MEGFIDKAKSVAEGVAAKAKEGVEDVQAKRERSQLVTQLGNDSLELLEQGAIAHPKLQATADKIREIDVRDGPTATPPEASSAAAGAQPHPAADPTGPAESNGA